SNSCSPSSSLPCSQTSRITSSGRRCRTASIASLLLWARRALFPSSSRIPAISMQMSRSSSTIRISWPMTLQTVRDVACGSLCGRRLCGCRRDFLRVAPEYQTDAGAATLAVVQCQQAPVVLHDLLDDGQAQSGTLAAGCHAGLGEPLATGLGQALAVVLDDDAHDRPFVVQAEGDLPGRQALAGSRWISSFDRLG